MRASGERAAGEARGEHIRRAEGPRAPGGERDNPADHASTRLAALQGQAAAVYEAITAADTALRKIAGHRVDAERLLRHDAARREAASRALAAHDRARPGPLARLGTGFGGQREWLERRAALAAALAGIDREVTFSLGAVSRVKQAFASKVDERAASVAELRRLIADCTAANEEIAALAEGTRSEPDAPEPESR